MDLYVHIFRAIRHSTNN